MRDKKRRKAKDNEGSEEAGGREEQEGKARECVLFASCAVIIRSDDHHEKESDVLDSLLFSLPCLDHVSAYRWKTLCRLASVGRTRTDPLSGEGQAALSHARPCPVSAGTTLSLATSTTCLPSICNQPLEQSLLFSLPQPQRDDSHTFFAGEDSTCLPSSSPPAWLLVVPERHDTFSLAPESGVDPSLSPPRFASRPA